MMVHPFWALIIFLKITFIKSDDRSNDGYPTIAINNIDTGLLFADPETYCYGGAWGFRIYGLGDGSLIYSLAGIKTGVLKLNFKFFVSETGIISDHAFDNLLTIQNLQTCNANLNVISNQVLEFTYYVASGTYFRQENQFFPGLLPTNTAGTKQYNFHLVEDTTVSLGTGTSLLSAIDSVFISGISKYAILGVSEYYNINE
jgi:hypothetical protein